MCWALPSVCSSTGQVVLYRRMYCGVDSQRGRAVQEWLFVAVGDGEEQQEGVMLLEQVQRVGARDGLGAAVDGQFPIDAVDMPLHRAHANDEFLRDGGVGQARDQQL